MGLGRISYLHGFASMMKIERVDVIGIAQVWATRGFWLGCKTNRGFYDYSGETPVPTR